MYMCQNCCRAVFTLKCTASLFAIWLLAKTGHTLEGMLSALCVSELLLSRFHSEMHMFKTCYLASDWNWKHSWKECFLQHCNFHRLSVSTPNQDQLSTKISDALEHWRKLDFISENTNSSSCSFQKHHTEAIVAQTFVALKSCWMFLFQRDDRSTYFSKRVVSFVLRSCCSNFWTPSSLSLVCLSRAPERNKFRSVFRDGLSGWCFPPVVWTRTFVTRRI